ncbi:MAG: hypothetical protein QG597_830, partial [Actinomycetota bacterium]|nr:hypothetical protein [Actinomycetota bacterium]
GRPRCAVITTAHLSDEQRQSATSLILGKLITWMRRQSGTTDLRAMLYMDEVAGYLPPTANPPTKKPIMLLMKQARAFGLGVVLSTQNPVDVDYKALSNAGTWLVGRLSTDQDKARLLDGMSSSDGGVDAASVGGAISALGKRQFVLRRAGGNAVEIFGTKWARSYLRGPMTRDQIAAVMAPVKSARAAAAPDAPTPPTSGAAAPTVATPTVAAATAMAEDEVPVMPAVAEGIATAYLDPAAPWAGTVGAVPPAAGGSRLVAAAVARVIVRYDDAKAGLAHEQEYEAVISPLPASTVTLEPVAVDYDDRDLIDAAPQVTRYAAPEADIGSKTYWNTLKRDLTDYLVRNKPLEILVNPELKAYSRVGETEADFRARCLTLADAEADKKTAALQTKYQTKLRGLQTKLGTAQNQAAQAEAARNAGAMSDVGSMLGGLFGGRKSTAGLAAAARRTQAAHSKAQAAAGKVDDLASQIAEVEAQLAAEVQQIDDEWRIKAAAVQTQPISPKKTNVRVTDLRLLWLPVSDLP